MDITKAALAYAKTIEPLDPGMGWRREDVQLAFAAGARRAQLLSIKDVADLLAASVSTIRDLVAHGELAYIKVGRGTERNHMAFAPDEIESFIKRHTKRDFIASRPGTARKSSKLGKTKLELSIARATKA
jgi:excisionase family DNA binding protein